MESSDRRRLFVYDSLLSGEPQHAVLEGAEFIGRVRTAPGFQLVELQAMGALVEGGGAGVEGELYWVDRPLLARIDVRREVPILFQRAKVKLEDGSQADTYVMSADQVRGRRRLHEGDWRARFSARRRGPPSPLVAWARGRSSKP